MRAGGSKQNNLAALLAVPFGNRLIAERDISIPRADRKNEAQFPEVHMQLSANDDTSRHNIQKRWQRHSRPLRTTRRSKGAAEILTQTLTVAA